MAAQDSQEDAHTYAGQIGHEAGRDIRAIFHVLNIHREGLVIRQILPSREENSLRFFVRTNREPLCAAEDAGVIQQTSCRSQPCWSERIGWQKKATGASRMTSTSRKSFCAQLLVVEEGHLDGKKSSASPLTA